MTDADLVLKRLAYVETCVQQLRTMVRVEAIESDLREERFAEHTLQLAIQAALDAASHVVSAERLGEPNTNRELFDLLARAGWIPPAMVEQLKSMVGFRNIVVHGYLTVQPRIVRQIVETRLDDLVDFVTAMRGRLLA